MTPAKEVTQEIASVTNRVTLDRISAMDYTPLQTDQALDQADTQAHKGHDDESQDQRIFSDNSGVRADPLNGLSDKGSDRGQNGRDSDSSLSKNLLSFFKSKFLTVYMNDVLQHTNHNEQETKANKITYRLCHEEVGELCQKPQDKFFHFRHNSAPPKRNRQKIKTTSKAQEQSQA